MGNSQYAYSMSFDLPEFSSVNSSFSFNGYVDDYLYVYLNGNLILNIEGNPGSENFWNHWIPSRTYGMSNVYQVGTNVIDLYGYNRGKSGRLVLYSTTVNITYITK